MYHLSIDASIIHHIGGRRENDVFELKQTKIGKLTFTFLLSKRVRYAKRVLTEDGGFLLLLTHCLISHILSSSKPGAMF
jgi:hypothetical protein